MLTVFIKNQSGLTIVELLVGMAVGLLVMLAVTSVYINTLRTSAETLDGSRLNQEVSAIMNIMVNDIRRAHFWEGAAAAFTSPTDNPFMQVENAASALDISALRIHDNGGSGTTYTDVTYDTDGFVTDADNNYNEGSCITYTYDADRANGFDNDNDGGDGDSDDEEFGFRYDGDGILRMRTSNNDTGPNKCGANSGNWLAVNEVNDIRITNLNFSIKRSYCLNASEPDGTDDDAVAGDADWTTNPEEFDCYSVAPTTGSDRGGTDGDGTGDSTVETILVDITLTAELADDPSVSVTQTQSVQVRNNLIRSR